MKKEIKRVMSINKAITAYLLGNPGKYKDRISALEDFNKNIKFKQEILLSI